MTAWDYWLDRAEEELLARGARPEPYTPKRVAVVHEGPPQGVNTRRPEVRNYVTRKQQRLRKKGVDR